MCCATQQKITDYRIKYTVVCPGLYKNTCGLVHQDAISISNLEAKDSDKRIVLLLGASWTHPFKLRSSTDTNCGKIDMTHTTPYHPLANDVVKQGNCWLGNSLQANLLEKRKMIPVVTTHYGSVPSSMIAIGESANMIMME